MSDTSMKEDSSRVAMNNIGYQSANALQIRLNTEPILQTIEWSLRGYQEKADIDEHGRAIVRIVKTGRPLANELGITRIMSYLRGIFNPQIVQGNFNEDMMNEYLYTHRKKLAQGLIVNIKLYDIKTEEFGIIMDMIFSMLEPYMSRTLQNKERESYANFMQIHESNTQQMKGGGLKLPWS